MPDLDRIFCDKEKCNHPASRHELTGPHQCLVEGCYCAWFHIPLEFYNKAISDGVEQEFALAVTNARDAATEESSTGWAPIEPAVSIGKFENTNEIRTTSSTGGQKGVKPEMFSLIPVEALEIMARLYGFGAKKYAAHNWRKGYEWSKSFDSLFRHAFAALRGEDIDEETGLPHLAGAAFHCFTLMVFMQEHPEFDDRFKKKIEEFDPEEFEGVGLINETESDGTKRVAHDDDLARILWESDTQEYLVSWDDLSRQAADPENFSGQRAAWLRTITMARTALKAGYYRAKD